MSEIVIETKQLTKQYGTQKSVAELNIHEPGLGKLIFPHGRSTTFSVLGARQ